MKKQQGATEIFLIILVLIIAILMVGGLFKIKTTPSYTELTANTVDSTNFCCDSGSGANCKVLQGQGQTFTFNGDLYGLLKSNITFLEAPFHLKDSGQKFNNNPVIINSSDGYQRFDAGRFIECINGVNQDSIYKAEPQLGGNIGSYCLAIPNDELVYVCKKNCKSSGCPLYDSFGIPYDYSKSSGLSCYGDTSSVYDVYFRVKDEQNPGIPDVIKNCQNSNQPIATSNPVLSSPKIVLKDQKTSLNLQLKTFEIEQTATASPGISAFLSPFCKPAIYLYPKQKTQINVKIAPKGPVTLTIPNYPKNGWNVTAYPSGKIESNGNVFPYLYYEAQIPDNLLTKEKNGYVVEYKNLESLFQTLLPKLGLNEKEKNEFSDYWLKVLPASPFYFVGVVSTQTLDGVSPLNISPKPQTIIRVGLYFEPLTEKIAVSEPKFFDTARKGFTVVEWGGLFKKEKNSNFTCIM